MNTDYYTKNDDNELMHIQNVDSKYKNIKYIIVDVDGTLTDGGIYYDENNNEVKKFNTKDAAGFFAAKVCGIKTMILTGRECNATTRRMKELQVDYLNQEVLDKKAFLLDFISQNNIDKGQIAYIGDDLNDYEPMKLAGFKACPNDSADEIIELCDYVSPVNGGYGAVRDIMKYILTDRGQWQKAVNNIFRIGT